MSSFGQKARSAVIWNTGFNLFRDLLQFGTMLVLVRILEPAAYGQFGLVTSVIGFLSIFSFNNFIAHTIQVRDEADVHYQDHFTAGAVMAGTMFVVTNLVAIALRWFENYAPVATLVHVMSLTLLLEWPCELRRKMLERQFDWKRLRLLHACGLLASAVLAIGLAAAGAGVYALLVPGMTVTLPFIYDLFVRQRWRPDWTWSWANYRAAWHFGLKRIGSGMAGTGRLLIESATLVKVLGYGPLGILNRALGLAAMFCSKFASQLMYATYPILTRLNPNPENIARVNGLVLRIVAWVAIPMAAVLSALATPVVHTVYGRQWLEVIPLLPWTMLGGVLIALAQTANSLLLAQQQPTRCLIADLCVLAGTVTMLLLVLPRGIKPYLIGLATVQLAALALLSVWLCSAKALKPSGIVWAVAPPLAGAGVAWLLCELARVALGADVADFWSAVVYGSGFALLYLAALRLLFPQRLGEIVFYLPARDTIGRLLILKAAA